MAEPFTSRVAPPNGMDAQAGPAHWWVVRAGEILVLESGAPPFGVPPVVDVTEDPIILGSLGDHLVWAVGVDHRAEAPPGYRFAPLRALVGQLAEDRWVLAGRAVQLVEWARTSRYCGRCGAPTVASPGERGMRCPACGLVAYPRLAPAVITLVERGDEVLLANGRAFGTPMYSCLAGFVEPGETLEAAVRREVGEEVGVDLDEVRYFGSQPWPFPHSLMIGFLATWGGGDIVIDETEMADAGWFSAGAMPMIPPRMSIARALIDDWLRRQGVGA
jgi:NAD+ diphosphatase